MFRRDYRIHDQKTEVSPPVSPVRELAPLLSGNKIGSSAKSPPSPPYKQFGPRENKFPLFQTTQEELLRVAIEKKRASSRIRQSMALRAAMEESERPFVTEQPEDDFAAVTEEDGEFVMKLSPMKILWQKRRCIFPTGVHYTIPNSNIPCHPNS